MSVPCGEPCVFARFQTTTRFPFLCLLLVFAATPITAEDESAGAFLRDAAERLDGRELSLDELRRLARRPGVDRDRVLALRARYERLVRGDPVAALEVLLPRLVGDEDAARWRLATRRVRREAQRESRASRRGGGALPEPDPRRIHAPVPDPGGWRTDEEVVWLVVEAVRALADLGRHLDAQDVCRAMGEEWGYDLPRLLAGEAYGDLLVAAGHPQKAVEAYTFAIAVADRGLDADMQPEAEIRFVRSRARASRKRVRRLLAMPDAAKWYEPDADPASAFFARCRREIARRELGAEAMERLETIADTGPAPHRESAAALLARLWRIGGEPEVGLAHVSPVLLPDAEGKEAWEPGTGFPAPAVWRFDAASLPSAAEAARCLAALGESRAALAAFDRIKGDARLLPHVLAVEGGARLQITGRRFARAVELFRYNLDLLSWFLVDRRGADRDDAYGEVARLIARNRAGLAEAERLLDAERYGPGFVLYRECERLRRKDGKPLRAYLRYGDLVEEFPGSIYAEAARCYRVRCLLPLATPAGERRVADAVAQIQERLADREESLRKARADEVAAPLLAARARRIEPTRARLARLREVPSGEDAFATARRSADELLAANRIGFYRGEALLAIAEHLLFERLEPSPAEAYLERGRTWIEEAVAADAELVAFAVPDRAGEVTAAPESTYEVDRWGNLTATEIPIGALVNRRDAPWYLDQLRAAAARQLGFLAFVDGDMDRARGLFEEMSAADEKVVWAVRRGGPNMRKRLMVRLEQGTFRRATPEHLAPFRDSRRRFVVFLADFLAEAEQPGRAEELYLDLLEGRFGELSPGEEAYARFGAGWSMWYRGVRDDDDRVVERSLRITEPILERADLQRTAMGPRCLVSLGNAYAYCSDTDDDRWADMERTYRLVIERYPGTKHHERALYYLGTEYLARKDAELRRRGFDLIEKVLHYHPDGELHLLARKALEFASKTEEER